MSLGLTISRLRKQRGLTQTEFAEQMDVNQSLVTRWERNVVQPRAKTIERMAQVLGITERELLSGDLNGVTSTLEKLEDEELASLIGRLHKLNRDERAAIKIVLDALLKRIEMEEMVRRSAS